MEDFEEYPIKDDDTQNTNEKNNKKGPLITIICCFLILLVIILTIPHYAVKIDPEPKRIVKLEEVSDLNFEADEINHSISSLNDFLRFLNANDPEIKDIADKIVKSAECDGVKICYAKAMLYFVRENIEYINDPPMEYIKSARETLLTQAGDCDDQSVLLANLLQAIGIETRFVFIENHVYIEARIPDAVGKYQKEGWVAMDATCKYCELGDSSYESNMQTKFYV